MPKMFLSARQLSLSGVVLFGMFQLVVSKDVQKPKTMVCYYRNWAQYYSGYAKFLPEDIDPTLCTVISYHAMEVNLTSHKFQGRQKNDAEMLKRIIKLKDKNKELKVIVNVGGWNHDKKPRFSLMVRTPERRKAFINSTLQYLSEHNLDGVNLDWEYPGYRGSPPDDKQRFTSLLKELSHAFKAHAKEKNVPRFYLSIAGSASNKKVAKAYEVAEIAKYINWVDVMAYNLRGSWRGVTGCPTLLEGKEPTVPGAIALWMNNGMPAEKINLGLSLYGRTYILADKNSNKVGALTIGKGGPPGPFVRRKGILSHAEICYIDWSHKTPWYQSKCRTPYASVGPVWVAYDDADSIREKINLLVKPFGLNGVSMWALDFDDFTGENCNQKKYPLIRAVNELLKN